MRVDSSRRWLWAMPVLLGLAACSTVETRAVEELPPINLSGGYTLGPGDKIRLSLYGDDSFSGEYNISPSGEISVPLVGNQQAAGLTISALSTVLSERLAAGYYRDPRLTAEIIAYRPFYIIGEVKQPGEYPYSAGLTLRKAVAVAGGYTYRANTGKVVIKREDMDRALRVRSEQSIKIGPGDTIQILERYF